MERASAALAGMDYLECEALCLQALALTRDQQRWADYARILMPLQESRRQRRIIAADGVIRLGTARLTTPTENWLRHLQAAGCIVVTQPHTAEDAHVLEGESKRLRQHVEVLFADNTSDAPMWRLRSFAGPSVSCVMPAPPEAWLEQWLAPGERPEPEPETDVELDPATTPADWFIDATEALGDAAMEHVTASPGDPRRIEQLEQMLRVVTDHEILHQRLGDAARAMLNVAENG